MGIDTKLSTQMSIDLKKNRIRIHKDSLHLIGDPLFIQLLVNPEHRLVAIRSVENQTSENQAYRVSRTQLVSDFSVEIYSHLFIKTLETEFDCFRGDGLFRMNGFVVPEEKAAVFSIDSLQPYMGGVPNAVEGQGDSRTQHRPGVSSADSSAL